MMSSLYLFARGHRLLTAAVVLFTLALAWLLGDGWGLLFAGLMAAFAALLWRDAPRAVPTQSGAVLSPADGRVVRIEKARDPYANRDALRISVFMNLLRTISPNLASGRTTRFSAARRRDISFSPSYFGRFAPYFERRCLRSLTPCVSRVPRMMW